VGRESRTISDDIFKQLYAELTSTGREQDLMQEKIRIKRSRDNSLQHRKCKKTEKVSKKVINF
jgi:uncharacterized protein (UPF0335 family)